MSGLASTRALATVSETVSGEKSGWSRAGTVTVESASVGVDVGALGDSVVIEVGACDAFARVTCGVNDET